MRYAFSVSLVAVLVCLLAAPALAGDGHVPQSTLKSLGLAGMQPVSDAEGMHVRGMSGCARVMGISLVSGLLLEPSTKNFVFGSDANFVLANAENAGCRMRAEAFKQHMSHVALELTVDIGGGEYGHFEGTLFGGAGGSGLAWAR
jgi:hypothetical protein